MTDNESKQLFSFTLRAERTDVTLNLGEAGNWSCGKLVIMQIILGADANDDENNVIMVNTPEDNLAIPIAVLRTDENAFKNAYLEFYEAELTFSLSEGSGPVHLLGHIVRDDFDN